MQKNQRKIIQILQKCYKNKRKSTFYVDKFKNMLYNKL